MLFYKLLDAPAPGVRHVLGLRLTHPHSRHGGNDPSLGFRVLDPGLGVWNFGAWGFGFAVFAGTVTK